jgi:hypothetical protein
MTSMAFAQEPAAIYVGPFDVVPELAVDVRRDNNIFNDISGSEVASTLTLVKPSINAVADDGVVKYAVGYQLENGNYSDTTNNNYTDHTFDATMDWRIDVRHLIELTTSVNTGHEDRSTDSVTNISATDLNEYTNKELGAQYTFGSSGARGRITLGFDTSSLRYSTNQATTSVLESDTDTKNVGVSLAFSPSARVNFQIVESENTFRDNSLKNRKDRSYLVGAEWEFTDTSKGIIGLGRTKNDLVNDVGDTSLSTGQIAVEWSPQEYSVFTFAADKSARNSENNVGSFIDGSEISVEWSYNLSDPVTIKLLAQQQKDDYIGVGRNDTTETFQLTFAYAMRRWLSFDLSIGSNKRESTNAAFTYNKETVNFSLNASL